MYFNSFLISNPKHVLYVFSKLVNRHIILSTSNFVWFTYYVFDFTTGIHKI